MFTLSRTALLLDGGGKAGSGSPPATLRHDAGVTGAAMID
jgi:hypothetical protein